MSYDMQGSGDHAMAFTSFCVLVLLAAAFVATVIAFMFFG